VKGEGRVEGWEDEGEERGKWGEGGVGRREGVEGGGGKKG